MNKLRLLIALLLLATMGYAQQMSVKSFRLLETDLEARAYNPKLDQNGQKCAIIKVVTTETGFTFDVGALGVTAVEYKTAEIWVYVPERTSKIKIAHPKLGQLDTETGDGYYWFPIGGVKSGCVYRLELVSGRVITTVEEAKQEMGWLIITSTPEGAMAYINIDGKEEFLGNTPVQKRLPYGTYSFHVDMPLYQRDNGIAHIESPRLELTSKLTPLFGSLSLTSNPSGATVSIEGRAETYTTPCNIDKLPAGDYQITLLKNRYSPYNETVTIDNGKTTIREITLEARFATITFVAEDADIYINDKRCGKGRYQEELTAGVYDIEARRANCQPDKRQITVEANKAQTITLTPKPIYGALDIITEPFNATVTLNGKEIGRTPLSLDELQIGDYTLLISKEGYQTKRAQVTITEKSRTECKETLIKTGETIASTKTTEPAKQTVESKSAPVEKTKQTKQTKPTNSALAPQTCTYFMLNYEYTFNPTHAYGFSIGQLYDTHGKGKIAYGWYATALVTIQSNTSMKTDETTDETGAISNGSIPFYTGKDCRDRLSAVIGGQIQFPLVGFYAGIGVGYNGLAFQTVDDQWVCYQPQSFWGCDMQFGLHWNIKNIVVRTGVATTNFRTCGIQVGLAYSF